MKVLQVCSYFLSSDLYEKLYSVLEKEELENLVYIPHHEKSTVDKNIKDLSKENLILSKCYTSFDRIFFHIKEKKMFRDMCQKVDVSNIDLCHAHSLFANGYLAYKVKKAYNIPYIVAVRNTDVNVFFKYFFWLRKIGIRILQNADKVIFISPAYKTKVISEYIPFELQEKISNKSLVIPNGVDNFWLTNCGESKNIDVSKKTINLVFVGSIDKNKNVETTLKACDILVKKGYSVKFGIIGDVEEKQILNHALKRDYVIYYGRQSKEQIIEIFKSYDIFVMPSFYETFGLVYVEAMSQGLPVIYTKGQGFDGWFPEGTVGYAVIANSETDIVEKIILILEKYKEISKNCCNRVNKFDWEELATEYFCLYQDIHKLPNGKRKQ